MSETVEQGELVEELKQLGHQLGMATRALWKSDESVSLRRELEEGLTQLGREIHEAARSARNSEPSRELEEQFQRTVRAAKETDLSDEARRGLLKSLRYANHQLDQFIASMESQADSDQPEGTT
jgi:hypothetical protein